MSCLLLKPSMGVTPRPDNHGLTGGWAKLDKLVGKLWTRGEQLSENKAIT